MYTLIVGADIASDTIQLHWHHTQTGEQGDREIKQNQSSYQTIIERLQKLTAADNIHVVMEATGNYWLHFALAAHAVGFAVSVVNPRQSHYFAQYRLRQTKTDKVDARLLCQMAQMDSLELWTPPPSVYHQLQQRVSLRQDLQDTRTQYKNRLHALRHNPNALPDIIARLEALISSLEKQVKQLEQELEALLHSAHEWHDAAQRLLSITGISTISATWILVATHAFARCDTPEQAASFAGLAPHERSSGQHQRKGQTGGGHDRLRSILYMAAGNAIQKNEAIRPFYERLIRKGKIKNVVRVAVARKLIHIAWACVVKARDFDPHYGQQHPIA